MATGGGDMQGQIRGSWLLMMEPFVSPDLSTAVDLTLPMLRDLGWYPDRDLDLAADAADRGAPVTGRGGAYSASAQPENVLMRQTQSVSPALQLLPSGRWQSWPIVISRQSALRARQSGSWARALHSGAASHSV